MIVTIRPCGNPMPQGSIAFKGMRRGKPIMVSDNDATLKPWRRTVAMATRAALGAPWEPLDEPVEVRVRLWVPAPQRPRWWRPAVKPDVDKLGRAILDGLADGGAYINDSRVTDLHVSKRYADEQQPMGARVELRWGYDLPTD